MAPLLLQNLKQMIEKQKEDHGLTQRVIYIVLKNKSVFPFNVKI